MKYLFVFLAIFTSSCRLYAQESAGYTLRFAVQQYDHAHFNKLTNRTVADSLKRIHTQTGSWEIKMAEKQIEAGTTEYTVVFRLKTGFEKSAAALVELEFDNWSKENYL